MPDPQQQTSVIPPLPPGYRLDAPVSAAPSGTPALPSGYTLDAAAPVQPDLTAQNAVIDKMQSDAGITPTPAAAPTSKWGRIARAVLAPPGSPQGMALDAATALTGVPFGASDVQQRIDKGAGDFVKSQIPRSPGDFARLLLATPGTPQGMAYDAATTAQDVQQQGVLPTLESKVEQAIPFPVASVARKIGARQYSEALGESGAAVGELAAGGGIAKAGVDEAAQAAKLAEKRASNFSAALEMGGKAPKGVMTHEDVTQPIINDVRAEAARQNVTADDFTGRKGYGVATDITGAVRQMYDNAYHSLVEPIREQPAQAASLRAAQEVISKMSKDAELLDELKGGGNVADLKQLSDRVGQAKTIGDLDDLRVMLNRLSARFEGKSEAGQYQSPLFQESLKTGADAIRNSLYPEIAQHYKGAISAADLRDFQRTHGAAIQADQLMQDTASAISRAASAEGAPAGLIQRLRGNAYRATMSPIHAAGGIVERAFPPSDVELFNSRMKRALAGSSEEEGSALPSGPPPAPLRAGQRAARETFAGSVKNGASAGRIAAALAAQRRGPEIPAAQ
ncbi:MAG: hypothetical protein ACYDA9_14050 [Terriglobia bacterium]